MKCTLFLLAALLLAPAPLLANSSESDQQALRHIKTVLWPKAYAEQDTALLDSILADEFQMIDAAGNWTDKRDELEYIANNKSENDSFVFTIKRLDIFENGTAVAAGEGVVKNTNDDDELVTVVYQSSNILIKRDGRWQAIASHVSGVNRTVTPAK
ncbi:MAG: hypothetical protein DHS20C11_08230 [Lysobacteraceae bacterium]|nr:MAG: hypothetical protein DHS20C11_08230 [Xanthomonadaceae bacterium]